MKSLLKVGILIILVLSLVACGGQVTHEKAANLLEQGKYEDASKIYVQLVDEDELDFEAWFGMIEAYIQQASYGEAEAALESLMEVIQYAYNDEPEVCKPAVIQVMAYVNDIIDETDEIGNWYRKLQPEAISLNAYEFSELIVGTRLVLDVVDISNVYYNFSGDAVSKTDIKYIDGIDLLAAGEFTLSVAAISDIGIIGEESRAFITVFDEGDLLSAPRINYESGNYEGPITIRFSGYDSDMQDVYYVLDGTDAEFGYVYNPEKGLELYAGDYQLVAVLYDWEMDVFSSPVYMDISVEGMTSEDMGVTEDTIITLAILEKTEDEVAEISWAVDAYVIESGNEIEVLVYDDVNDLMVDYTSAGIDIVYGEAIEAVDLYNYIGDVTYMVDLSGDYSYYPGVVEAVYFWDAFYCLPVTVRPAGIMYYNYANLVGYYNKGIDYETFIGEMDNEAVSSGLVLPESTDLYFFLSLYYGFGGQVENEIGYIDIEYPALVETLTYYQTLVEGGYLNPDSGLDIWQDAIYYGDADFIVAETTNYAEEDFSINYEPTGGLPLPNGSLAIFPSVVDGLFVDYDIAMDQGGFKASVIKGLYDFMATETEYNGYIAYEAGAMPAISGIVNEDDYSAILNLSYYETLIEAMPPLSLDFYHLFGYMDIQSILMDVMNNVVSPEEGADRIIESIDDAYLE